MKVDNRPLAARQLDRDRLEIGTFGGHYIAAVDQAHGTVDLLAWGAAQVGSWGRLAHRAAAFAAEAGWQPKIRLAPWIRGGFDYASGDGNPDDSMHRRFFQVLPTPRLYARFPFFNLMNSADPFGELILRPAGRVTTRFDIHALRLADASDLWYQGGGAFQPATFGYVGLPVSGHQSLSTLYDASADITVSPSIGESGAWVVGPAVSATVNWDHHRQLQDRSTSADFDLSLAGHFDARVSRAQGYELFSTIPFRKNTTNVSLSSSALRWLSVWGLYSQGTAINYTPAAGVAPFLGSKQGAYASMTLRPSTRLRVEQIVLHEHFETIRSAVLPKQRVFDTTLVRWKANVQITRSLSVRGIVDYNQLESVPALFLPPGYSRLMGDVLVRYLLHPGTAVYVGVNHGYENLVIDRLSPSGVSHAGAPTFPVSQQVFVKLSYLFRF